MIRTAMPLTEKLPGCRELLSLCDNFPRPALVPTDMSPIKLPPPSLEDGRRIRSTRLTLKPYPSTPGTRVSGATRARKRKDTFDREEQRKEKLENDPWSDKSRLTPKSVFCLGCHRHIRLDRRNDYYPGLWLKHRGLCHGIVKARKEAAAERQIVKREEEKMYYSRPPIDDDEAAEILAGMMIKSRCFSDSDTASTYSSS